MHRGHFKLWRKFKDSAFWTEPREFSKFEAWLDILTEAQFEPGEKEVSFGMKTLTQNRGEVLFSTRTWAKRWLWSEARVRRFLKLLENMKMICSKSEGITTRINVINYDLYNPLRRANDADATQMRRNPDADATTTKEGKKGRKKERKNNGRYPAPSLPEVIKYFEDNQYLKSEAIKAFNYYEANKDPVSGNWKDKNGNIVKNWKQKMIGVWFREENKDPKANWVDGVPPIGYGRSKGVVL